MQDENNNLPGTDGPWFLRRSEDEIRGPVDTETLREWAESGEIAAGQEVSLDCKEWHPVETLPALDMTWTAEVKDGSEIGPFNILAASRLVEKGILESDSVIRKHEPQVEEDSSAAGSMEDNPEVQNRIGHLEDELDQLRRQLKDMTAREEEPEPSRALTDTARSAVTRDEPVDMLAHREDETAVGPDVLPAPRSRDAGQEWRLGSALYARPEKYPVEEPGSFLIEDSDELRAMARTRRFRAHALRWNAIASSVILGTGVTLGSLGYMLDYTPLQFSGVIIAFAGLAYLIVATVLLLMGFFVSRLAMQVSAHESVAVEDEQAPPSGALNITIYWFNRTFRSRH